MNYDEFETKVVNNKNQKCFLIMDEVQVAYHVSSFWRMFKFGSTCYVLAFAAFSVDDKRVKVKSVDAIAPTPAVFADTRSYPFVAFTRAEFDEVARQFQEIKPHQINEKVIEFVGEQVQSLHQADQANFYDDRDQPPTEDIRLYHPGLAYACFSLISKFRGQEESILVQYGTGSNLCSIVFDASLASEISEICSSDKSN